MAEAVSVGVDGSAAIAIDLLDSAEAYIPGDRRRALADGTTIPDRVRGAALFADISGFTPLTEALANELGEHRGAEELTTYLNRIFHALIAELERYGGDVIYFSGDAITCWIDGDDGARATACALAMQETMGRASGSALSYDTVSGRYSYVWKTEKAWAGTCRQLILVFNDGSIQRANFRFK